jgi:hypothetical protein
MIRIKYKLISIFLVLLVFKLNILICEEAELKEKYVSALLNAKWTETPLLLEARFEILFWFLSAN